MELKQQRSELHHQTMENRRIGNINQQSSLLLISHLGLGNLRFCYIILGGAGQATTLQITQLISFRSM